MCPFSSLYSLKLECEKLASEKTEMQRHYIMVSPDRSVQQLYTVFFFVLLGLSETRKKDKDISLFVSLARLVFYGLYMKTIIPC